MWTIVSDDKREDVRYLLQGSDVSAGRKDCDILIATDQSISRKHVVLRVTHDKAKVMGRSAVVPRLTVKDLSKFGTFINGRKLSGETELRDGDKMTFGVVKTPWVVSYRPWVVASSCLDAESRHRVVTSLVTLGGHLSSEWTEDCRCLVMSKITVTVKTVSALICARPVVTPLYLEDTVTAVREKRPLPDPVRYRPELGEPTLDPSVVSFDANPDRKRLFVGMTFVFFLERQYKRLKESIRLAGGTTVLMGLDLGLPDDDATLLAPMTCVMHADPQEVAASQQRLTAEQKARLEKVVVTLKKGNRRAIPDSEMGLAVLHVSTEKFCNPEITPPGPNLLPPLPSQTLDRGMDDDVLVPDTCPTEDPDDDPPRPEEESALVTTTVPVTPPNDARRASTRGLEITAGLDSQRTKTQSTLDAYRTDTSVAAGPDRPRRGQGVTASLGNNLFGASPAAKRLHVSDDSAEDAAAKSAKKRSKTGSGVETTKRKMVVKTGTTEKRSKKGVSQTGDGGDRLYRDPVYHGDTQDSNFGEFTVPPAPRTGVTDPDSDHENSKGEDAPSTAEIKVVVEYRPLLVARTDTYVRGSPESNSDVKNFKKFRKSYKVAGSVKRDRSPIELVAHRQIVLEDWAKNAIDQDDGEDPEREGGSDSELFTFSLMQINKNRPRRHR